MLGKQELLRRVSRPTGADRSSNVIYGRLASAHEPPVASAGQNRTVRVDLRPIAFHSARTIAIDEGLPADFLIGIVRFPPEPAVPVQHRE
jgi:hypothetical protein